MSFTIREIDKLLDETYEWSKARGFKGYNKHDALNSPLVRIITGWSKWTRILAVQFVMRFPVNVRSLLMTRKTYNPKGLALFVSGLVDRYHTSGDQAYIAEALSIIKILESQMSEGGWSGSCWGYHYPWQDLNFFADSKLPNAVVTCFVCEAYLDLYEVTKDKSLLDRVNSAMQFLLRDLPVLFETPSELCLSYIPRIENKVRVMDVSILTGAVLARFDSLSGSSENVHIAKRLVRYVVNRQQNSGAWYYTDPPEHSPIRHDNYHTGFILDALDQYRKYSGDETFAHAYENGLQFYRDNLFTGLGAPKWMSDQEYPYDIHGSAQGLISFSRSFTQNESLLERIFNWMTTNLYSGDGRFYYQRTRFFTKRITFMRWCNAWGFRSIARYQRMRMEHSKHA